MKYIWTSSPGWIKELTGRKFAHVVARMSTLFAGERF